MNTRVDSHHFKYQLLDLPGAEMLSDNTVTELLMKIRFTLCFGAATEVLNTCKEFLRACPYARSW
jgi:hypothetical protein